MGGIGWAGAQGANGAPVFRRRVQVTHPFKGLLPPTGTILQVWPFSAV